MGAASSPAVPLWTTATAREELVAQDLVVAEGGADAIEVWFVGRLPVRGGGEVSLWDVTSGFDLRSGRSWSLDP